MIDNKFYEKLTLVSIFLILNNYLLLSFGLSQFFLKINFVIFMIVVFVFYFKNFLENYYLKLFFLVVVIICLGTPISEWDPRSTWFFHAKRIFYDQSIYSVIDNYAPFSHNEYPMLASAFASSLAILVGYWNEVFPKLAFSLMFIPPLIFMYLFFKSTKYLIFLSIVIFTTGKFLFNGWADGILAIYFGISAFILYLLTISDLSFEKKNIYYLIAFCFFVALTLIKSEGLALLLILFITSIIVNIYQSRFKRNISTIFILLLSFTPIILWKLFCYNKGIGIHYIFESNFFHNFSLRYDNLENYKLVAYFLLLNEKFIVTLLFFLFTFWINQSRILFFYVSMICISYILILFAIYLSTPLDFYFQLDSSAARVIKSLSFLLGLFGLYNLNLNKHNSS